MKRVIDFLASGATPIAIVIGLVALVIASVAALLGSDVSVLVTYGIAPAVLLLMLIISARIETLYYKIQREDSDLRREIRGLSHLVHDLAARSSNEQPVVDILETPFDFYRALNNARAESKKSIHVLTVRSFFRRFERIAQP